MSNPLVSVGISFLNSAGSLLNSIRSIFAQSYSNWELILVDDGSTDGSLDIARSIDDPRVRLLPPDGRNRRLPFRLNQIAQDARGEYLARMDADDLCHPERFSQQLDFLQNHPEVDVVGSSACILDREGDLSNEKLIVPETHDGILSGKFESGISIIHPTVMAKTEWFRRWPYDENNNRCEDYELWLRSGGDSVFANIGDILCFKDEFTSFTMSKYANSKLTVAGVIWRYASKEQGMLRACYHAGKRYVHIGIYAGALVCGLQNKLISRRYDSMSPEECAEISAVLDVIRSTDVPIRN